MTENDYNETELRAFLLGNLSEEARAGIEDRFLADEDFAAQLELADDELIESYLRGELSAGDEHRFRNAFLSQPRRRERVLAMKAVLAVANTEAPVQLLLRLRFGHSFQRSFISRALAGVAVAALVLFVMARRVNVISKVRPGAMDQ